MTKKIFILLLLFAGFFTLHGAESDNEYKDEHKIDANIKQLLEEKLNAEPFIEEAGSEAPAGEVKTVEKMYSFSYQDILVTDVIERLASEKGINILLPQGSQALTTKLNYSLPQKVTLDQAWIEMDKILELLGYTWELKNNILTLLKVDENIPREPLSLYRNPALEDLPDSGQVIQAIFYFSNLKVTDDPSNPIMQILKGPTGMLSNAAFKAIVKADPKTNSVIITDKANNIRAAMTIIRQLDLEGIPDAIEIITLNYVPASFVEDLFRKLLATAPQAPVGPARETTQKSTTYFPANTKVLALNRTNTIVIMGTVRSIRTVKEFIIKDIDFPLDSGKSILHLYDLQYLNAEKFAPVLQALVNKTEAGAQSQTQAQAVGPKRYFQDVIIEAEKTRLTAAIAPTAVGGTGTPTVTDSMGVQQGGNRLIIAARQEDWHRIKKLIRELDTPQPQVAIEVLVVDLTLTTEKLIADQMRNKGSFNNSFSQNLNFQTANIISPLLKPATTAGYTTLANPIVTYPANALAANLLEFASGGTTNLATAQAPGSLLISFNDPDHSGIWNIWQILDQFTNSTILTQPFIVTADNVQANISFSEDRLLAGGSTSDGGSISIKNEYVTAAASIDILPTISTLTQNINLQINITINTFLSNANNRSTRLIQTNANVGDGEVLALGGLVSTTDTITEFRTPLLARIPLIGWLFKYREKAKLKTNLLIFISPKIIQPKVGGGAYPYTENKLCFSKRDLQESANFENLRDPITRWFFRPDVNYAHDVVDGYVEEQSNFVTTKKVPNKRKEELRELEKLLHGEENPLLKMTSA